MSLAFFGWEVFYDHDHDHRLKAGEELKSGGHYTMYHGTLVQSARSIITGGFRQSPDGMLGPGVYISREIEKAQRYPLKASPNNRVVLILDVDAGKVKKIDQDNHPMQKTWHSQGFDTAWVPPKCGLKSVPSGLSEDCVWDPKRICVTDVQHASDSSIEAELKTLLQNSNQQRGIPSRSSPNCVICKKEFPHAILTCWACRKSICPFMLKHVCKPAYH